MPKRTATVLQVVPALQQGGVERGTLEIAEGIIAAGGKALVVSAGGRLVTPLEALGATHITLPLQQKSLWGIWQNSRHIARLCQQHQVDIIHARSRAPAWSAYRAATNMAIPFITTYHGTYGMKPWPKPLYNSVMAKGCRVIAVSRFVEQYIHRHHPDCPQAHIRVIPRGVDTRQFQGKAVSYDRITRLSRQWQLPDTTHPELLVLLAGRLSRWKGHLVAIEALKGLGQPCRLLCVGSGSVDWQEVLTRRARECGVAVQFAGHCDDMPAAYCLADIVLCPSTRPEAFGRTVIEAQAMGKIVIASDHGGAAETIEHGVTGFHAPAGNVSAWHAACQMVLALSPAERQRISDAAAWHAQHHFSTQAMITATLAVYEEVLASKIN